MKLTHGRTLGLILPALLLATGSADVQDTHAQDAHAQTMTDTPSTSPERSVEWRAKMRSMESVLEELLLDLSSDKRFRDPKRKDQIVKNTAKLKDLAHKLDDKKAASPDADPSIWLFSGLFSQEVDRAHEAMKRGERDYARGLIKGLTGYCIACHTRTPEGVRFPAIPFKSIAQGLEPLERGEFYASTRQFEQAMEEFEAILANAESLSARSLEWEKAARYALAIAVRVNQDPRRAMVIADRVIAAKQAPYFLREQARKWRQSIQEWAKEPSRKITTASGLHAEAKRLIDRARKLQEYPADRSADVVYLRASAVIHQLLGKDPAKTKLGTEGLFMAGVAYEALQDLNLWELHDLYYQACIHRSPHTRLARQCFARYQESIYAGFSGSAGLSLPLEVEESLKALDALSRPEGEEGNKELQ